MRNEVKTSNEKFWSVIDYGRRKIHGEGATGNAGGSTAGGNALQSGIQLVAFDVGTREGARRFARNDFPGMSNRFADVQSQLGGRTQQNSEGARAGTAQHGRRLGARYREGAGICRVDEGRIHQHRTLTACAGHRRQKGSSRHCQKIFADEKQNRRRD